MKQKTLFLSAFLILSLLFGFLFNKPSSESSVSYFSGPPPVTGFLLGAMSNHTDYNHVYIDDTFHMNMWHTYTWSASNSYKPNGWTTADSLLADSSAYNTGVKVFLDKFAGNENPPIKMKMFMMRPKIEYLCYGQRSDYQCEPVSGGDYYWFYSFQQHLTGVQTSDSGQQVIHCRTVPSNPFGDSPGFVVKRLKANNQQNNIFPGNHWDDSKYLWYIKPRIRIDSTFAHNNQTTPVCSIKVLSGEGSTIKEVVIKGANFLNGGNYNGRYLEEFYNLPEALEIQGAFGETSRYGWGQVRGETTSGEDNETDIQVYWYGNCDMWIDYVRVDNEIAHELFKGIRDPWIEWEAALANYNTGSFKSQYCFYIEELDFNNVPCIEYVNKKLQQLTAPDTVDMMVCFWWQNFTAHLPYDYMQQGKWSSSYNIDASTIKQVFLQKCNLRTFFTETYPFTGNDIGQNTISKIPNTLPYTSTSGGCVWADAISPGNYDAWLQSQLDSTGYPNPQDYGDNPLAMSRDPGLFTWAMKLANELAKSSGREFINMPQTHLWRFNAIETRREPTNEELKMTTNVALSYGAKGIINFWYGGFSGCSDTLFGKGYLDSGSGPGQIKRIQNAYQQPKWDSLVKIHQRVRQLAPEFYSFNTQYTNSYVYRLEYSSCLTNTYFNDIKTYPPDASLSSTPSSTADAISATYLQAAVFKKPNEPRTDYFMIINRRCSPFRPEISEDGGRRFVKVKFDNNTTWGTWKIINLETGQDTTFNRNASPYINLGWFMPAEGRLYKLVPVMVIGGELVTDENITGETFTCEDTVWNDGYDITFNGNGNTVSFSDSATIIMDGGSFRCGTDSAGPTSKNKFQAAVSGHKWTGLKFNNASVKIYNTEFTGISSPVGGNYAVSSTDCSLNDIRYNVFASSTDTAGGVNINFVNTMVPSVSSYIMYNTFTMSSSFSRAVQVQSFGGLTTNVYVIKNTMTSSGNATGVFLSTVTNGVVKNNSITGFSTGVNTVLSAVNLYGNTISNTSSLSKGILGTSSSSINLAPSGSQWIGGFNSIINTSGNSKNIDVSGSIFLMDGGKNTFDISSSGTPYHLNGTFWEDSYPSEQENNCFKVGGSQVNAPTEPTDNVTDGTDPISFDYFDYTCGASPPSGTTIVDIGNGLYDTIPTSGGGIGGGNSSKYLTVTPKKLYDSINVRIIFRDYMPAEELCYELIDEHIGSFEALASLQSLYLASTKNDTSSASVSALKTYYENLILNNGSNDALVKISNYLVQKCKVLLRQYTSAMSGFEEVINQNQYSYEGLLARWDYMATSLMLQGQGGAFKGDNDEGDDDKSPLTKEQKKILKQTVSSINEKTKNFNDDRVKVLEEKTKNGDAKAEKELKVMRNLKNVIKTERPRNISEHIRIVNNDIQAVFGSDVDNSPTTENNLPTVFRLSQNYPNPFNPVTKINFDLPKDSKVTLIIYDILGREVKRLVKNELKQAGFYNVEFNAFNYASGVYFYRIEAEELNGTKHVEAKKMVLVK